jgi:Tfp pilus assembly protein PilO
MSKKTTFFFTVSILAVLISGGILGFMVYSFSQAEMRIDDISTNLLNEKQREEEVLALRNTSLALRDKTSRIDAAFIKKSDIPLFVEGLERIAESSGIASSTFSIDSIVFDDAPGDVVRPLMLSLQGVGSWETVYGFTQEVENLPTISSVKGLMFSRAGEVKDVDQDWRVFINFEAFVIE